MAERPVVWLHGEVKTLPFSMAGRVETGALLRQVQLGHRLALPHSRPMPSVGSRCHELRVTDRDTSWRIIYRIDHDAVVIADVFAKKTRATPKRVIEHARRRLAEYDSTGKAE